MRKALLLFILFSSSYTAEAQNSLTRQPDSARSIPIFVSVNVGIAIPTDDYGTSNRVLNGNEVQGFATTGFSASIMGGVFISHNLAIVGKTALDDNSVNQSLFVSENGGNAIGGFQIEQYMGGIYYHNMLKKNTYLWVQAMAGVIHANYPSFTTTSQNISFTYSLQSENVLGLSCGVGFEKLLNKTTGLIGALSYTAATISYPSYSINTIQNYTPQQPTTMYYGSIQLTVGVSFHL